MTGSRPAQKNNNRTKLNNNNKMTDNVFAGIPCQEVNEIPDLSQQKIRRLAKFNILGVWLIGLNAIGWAMAWVMIGSLPVAIVCASYLPFAVWLWRVNFRAQYYKAFVFTVLGMVFWVVLIAMAASGPGLGHGGSVHGFFLTLAVAVFILLEHQTSTLRYASSMALVLLFFAFHLPIIPFTPFLDIPIERHLLASKVTWISVLLTTIAMWLWLTREGLRNDSLVRYSHIRLWDLFQRLHPRQSEAGCDFASHLIAQAAPKCSIMLVDIQVTNPHFDESARLEIYEALAGQLDNAIYDSGLDKITLREGEYLVAAGVTDAQPEHALALTALACQFIEIGLQYADVDMRLAIASGPATVARAAPGDFVYSVWGQVVEHANALMSECPQDSVIVSDATRQLIQTHWCVNDERRVSGVGDDGCGVIGFQLGNSLEAESR